MVQIQVDSEEPDKPYFCQFLGNLFALKLAEHLKIRVTVDVVRDEKPHRTPLCRDCGSPLFQNLEKWICLEPDCSFHLLKQGNEP